MAKQRLLHLTYHYGTANDALHVFTKLGYEVQTMLTTDLPYTITEDLAEALWQQHGARFQEFDVVLTSDTVALAFPCLLHLEELRPRLVIWICNRFNVCMEGQAAFERAFRAAAAHPRVTVVPYTAFERVWCRRFGIEVAGDVIPCVGRHEHRYVSEPGVMSRCFRDLDLSNRFLPEAQSVFLQDYPNSRHLVGFLRDSGVSFAFGRYDDMADILGYRAMVVLPDAFCKIGYMEAIQKGMVVFMPSLAFLRELVQHGDVAFTSKEHVTPDMLAMCQYYQYPDCYVFFSSFAELLSLLAGVDTEPVKEAMLRRRDAIHDDALARWAAALSPGGPAACPA